MSTIQELAERNNRDLNTINYSGRHILDANCAYDLGRFTLTCLPGNLPSLFTVRFTAPADYTADDKLVIKGKELEVRTPGMVKASSDMFKAGAVINCDVDMDRELAFFWQSGGTTAGFIPNRSFTEQFAGFYDVDGSKVYVKTIDLGIMPTNSTMSSSTAYPHGIENFDKLIRMDFVWGWNLGSCQNGNLTAGTAYCRAFCDKVNVYATIVVWKNYAGMVTLYYTCTDR